MTINRSRKQTNRWASVILVVLFLGAFLSCVPSDFYFWSYVNTYRLDVQSFELFKTEYVESQRYGIVPHSKKEINWRDAKRSETPEEDRAKFEALSLKNGDWSYNQEMEEFTEKMNQHEEHFYFASPILRVNFTSSQAWDGEHPAGVSLNDVLMCYTASPDEYIRNGYRKNMERLQAQMKEITYPAGRKFGERLIARTGGEMTPIVGRFSEIDFRKYRLVGCGIPCFYLDALITPPQGADLKIEVEFEDGRKVESTFVWPEK